MKKTICIILIVLCLPVFLWATPAYAASRSVPVKIALFPVVLNGVQLGNNYLNWLSENNYPKSEYYAQYPLLVYKDITYFPMTWYLSNLLNLNTTWSQGGGLAISKGDPNQWKYFNYDRCNEKNKVSQSASIVNFPVTVNGKPIDNSKEQYPLLLFRDITYFPLTWRFAVDEFGWRYSYSAGDGLRIEADNAVYYWNYDYSSKYMVAHEYVGADDTVYYDMYIRGSLKIWNEYRPEGHAFLGGKMYISQGDKTVQVGDRNLDRFGAQDLFEGMYRFRVEGNWVYTWYTDFRQEGYKPVPARVNILTKEFEILK
jgi:hypothetical protein